MWCGLLLLLFWLGVPKMPNDPQSVPKDVFDALVTNHPLIKGAKFAAEAGDWMVATGKDLYRKGQRALTAHAAPRKRTTDIYLPPSKGRSARKR